MEINGQTTQIQKLGINNHQLEKMVEQKTKAIKQKEEELDEIQNKNARLKEKVENQSKVRDE